MLLKEGYISKKRRYLVKLRVTTVACVLVIILSVFVVRYVNSNTEQNYCISDDSSFCNKYEFFSFAATKTNLKMDFKLYLFPEIDNQYLKGTNIFADGRNLNVYYESYSFNIFKQIRERTFDEYYDYLNVTEDNLEIIEDEDMKYIHNFCNLYYIKDGYSIVIHFPKEINDFKVMKETLKDIKFVQYEFISDELARGKVYDDTKILKYNFEGKDLELTYKYREINYKLCVEYDVFTDGVNDFMFDKNNTLVGYRINNSEVKVEELSKYVDSSMFKLEKQEDEYYEYRQYVNGLKTNGFAFAKLDKNGNRTELFVNEVKLDGDIPAISEKLLKKQIKNKFVHIYIRYDHRLVLDKIEQMRYSVDDSGDLVVICDVIAAVKTNINNTNELGVDSLPMVIVVKVKDCVG